MFNRVYMLSLFLIVALLVMQCALPSYGQVADHVLRRTFQIQSLFMNQFQMLFV
jgi:hypothetical protein